MKTNLRLVIALAAFVGMLGTLSASDWPGFRGSNGGVSDESDLPTKLAKENILWKIKLPGAGTSSPITVGDKLFLTANDGYGTSITSGFGKGGGKGGKGGKGGGEAGDQKKLKLVVLCLDRANGKVLWEKEIQPKLPENPFSGMMREHSYASATPISDGKNIYVFFGKSGVHAFDLDGKQLWSADVGAGVHQWGSAASPALHKDLLFVNASIESKAFIALDKNNGKEVWRKAGIGTSWSSPLVVETKDGKHEVVLSIPGKIVAYDPQSGKELWNCQGVVGGAGGGGGGGGGGGKGGMGGGYTASTPVARDGIVYAMGGGGGGSPMAAVAIKTGGSGDVNKSHVIWRAKAGATNCSPTLIGDQFCIVDSTVTCLNIKDGSVTYKERLYSGGKEYVSAVATSGAVYALTRNDGLYVFATGAKFEQLGHLEFSGDTSIFNASPAITGGRLYLRSNEYLYCVGKK